MKREVLAPVDFLSKVLVFKLVAAAEVAGARTATYMLSPEEE